MTVSGGAAADLDRVVTDVGLLRTTMRTYLDALLDQRRAHAREDLLSALLAAEIDGQRLIGDEILGVFQILLVAGSETTTNLLGNTLLCLADDSDALARLRATPALLPAVIEEVLRFRSPVQATFRRTRGDLVIGDRTIPAGKLVLAMIGAANRDPRQFASPERFDIDRVDHAHLAFGHGTHFCLGAPLARLEARVALPVLLGELSEIRLTAAGWEPREAFHVHGPARLTLQR